MNRTGLFLTAALAMGMSAPALAADPASTILNGQINLKDVVGEQNLYVADSGNVTQSASAQGNSLEASFKDSAAVTSEQVNHSNVEADLNLVGGWVEGTATTTAQSFTNAVTIDGNGQGGLDIDNYQEADPGCESCYDDAKTYIELDGVGVLDSSTTAVANSFGASNREQGMNVNSRQINNSKMSAVSNVFVGYGGSVNTSAAAVGNNVVIGQ